ncbi:MAG: Zn-dependent hydrolase [Gammaproteobacteria bacterium]
MTPTEFGNDRRRFVAQVTGGLLTWSVFGAARASTGAPPRVNAKRLQDTLEDLSRFGRLPGGSFADGVSRVAYSDADVAGRAYVMALMQDAGLNPVIDPAGNIIGRRAGLDRAALPIVIGSHIDSVPSGGNFDGDVGSMGAIEVVRTLNDHKISTRHPLEVSIWSNEEGGPIGSAAVVEPVTAETLALRFNGVVMRDGLRRIGGDPDRIAQAMRAVGSLHCYLELHIEQGGTLEQSTVPIGVVDGIVSIDEYAVEVRGFANHAGTTPMGERRDALLAASKLVEAVREIVKAVPGRQVGTVGRFEVFPNAPNVIPGLVKLSIEFRDLSADVVARLGKEAAARAQEIARQTATEIFLQRTASDPPALADPQIQAQIAAAAASLNLKTMHLPSGAGHDAQFLSKIAPMGMIFVPSVGGISHSPKELSRWSDVANGADVLLRTALGVDRIKFKATATRTEGS